MQVLVCHMILVPEWNNLQDESGYLRRRRPVNHANVFQIFGAATEAASEHFDPHTLLSSGVALGCGKGLIFMLLRLWIGKASTRIAVDPVFQGVYLCYEPKPRSARKGHEIEGTSGNVHTTKLWLGMRSSEGIAEPLPVAPSKYQ